MLCSLPGVGEPPKARVGHDGYPYKPVSGLYECWGLWSQQVSSSFLWGPFSYCGRLKGPFSFWLGPKESLSCPNHHNVGGPEGGGGDNAGAISSQDSSEAIGLPLGTSPLLAALQGG